MAVTRLRTARRPQRRISRLLAWLLAPFVAAFAFAQNAPMPQALPQGGQVRVGAGQIQQTGNLMLVRQLTPRLGLDWQRFDIGSDATVQFQQPGRSSIALNRVLGDDPSAIFGRLEANGQVFLTNPNGVLFGPGAKVDVGGLVASALDLSQADFEAGRFQFEGGEAGGAVLNLGRIAAEGYVALFGGRVGNEGEIQAGTGGSVVLASGRAATVSLSDSGLLSAVLTPGAAGRVHNTGTIAAEGGQVLLSAHSAAGEAPSLVNTSGLVRASSVVERGGEIHILGDRVATAGRIEADGAAGGRIVVKGGMTAGRVDVAGEFSAQATGAGAGGRIETSAAFVAIDPGTRVRTLASAGRHGEWVIDPTDFTVGAGAGGQTTSGIGASTLASNLQSGNVTLQTAPEGDEAGHIRVDAPVSWTADTVLTLSAAGDVQLNASLSATGNAAGLTVSAASGRFALAEGVTVSLPGSSPQLTINGTSHLVINSLDALQAMGADATARGRSYALGSDIDASATAGWNDGAGFAPVGNGSGQFSGNFDGLGHRITGLTINRPAESYVGLFGYVRNTLVSHVHLDGGSITGSDYVGGLVGYHYGYVNGNDWRGGLRNVSSNAPVQASEPTGTVHVGALAGLLQYGRLVEGARASASVTADASYAYAGGLVGRIDRLQDGLSDSQASGPVRSASSVYGQGSGELGGLVGSLYGAAVRDVNASGTVLGGNHAGGLFGHASTGTLENAAATGAVTSSGSYVGGLIGMADSFPVASATASGAVLGDDYAGGLIGYAQDSPIQTSAASGDVAGRVYTGGLVGYAYRSAISASQAGGAVQSRDSRAGGLVGNAYQSALTDVTASGDVDARAEAGGLVGYGTLSPITNGQASGDVRSASQEAGGLVGVQNDGSISASRATGNVHTDGSNYVGGLVGIFYDSSTAASIVDSSASGSVTGAYYGGGLVGYAQLYYGGGIVDSRASGDVQATYYAGGLVGNLYTWADGPEVSVRGSFASGEVRAGYIAGGLVGQWQGYNARIADSGATGQVTVGGGQTGFSTIYAGGLVGEIQDYGNYYDDANGLRIQRSWAGGDVGTDPARAASSMNVYAGGLVGSMRSQYQYYNNGLPAAISDSYASGRVQVASAGGYTAAGGLAGYLQNIDLTNTYSSGAVVETGGGSGDTVGGLAGYRSGGTVTASVWNTDTSGRATSAAGSGLNDAQMKDPASFAGWDLATEGGGGSVWRIYDGHAQPLLASFLRPLTLQQASAAKAYDGTNSLAGTGVSASNGDPIANPELIFVAGAGPGVGTFGFGAAALYSSQLGYDLTVLPAAGSSQLVIGARSITLTGAVADKVYDRSTGAGFVAQPVLEGLIPGDDLVLNLAGASAAFADPNAGSGKLVNVAGFTVADGAVGRAANYSVQGTALADITPAPVSVGSFTAQNRVYDGTTAVAVDFTNAGSISGVIAGDQVTLNAGTAAGTMADKHAGSAKPVSVSGVTLGGAQAANYRIAAVDQVAVDIAPRALTVDGLSPYDKTYNANTNVSIDSSRATLAGLVAGDQLLLVTNNVRGLTDDKNAGDARPVTITGLALTGPDALNYAPQAAPGLTVDVARANVNVYAYGNFVNGAYQHIKVYDGSAQADATVYTNGVYGGDAVTLGWDSISYADKNVARNAGGQVIDKTITVAGITLTGADASNYALQNTSYSFAGRIDPRALGVTGVTANNRIYDGTIDVAVALDQVSVDTSSVVPGDQIGVSVPGGGAVTGTMLDKHVGNNKAVTVPGLTLTGTDAGNYTLNAANGVTVDIAPKPVTLTYEGLDRVYDGNVYAFVQASSADFVAGDVVNLYTNVFCRTGYCGYSVFTGDGAKNVGTDKPIQIRYDALYSGADRGNYVIANPGLSNGTGNESASADLTPRPITPRVTGVAKVYDGSTAATVTLNRSSSGIISGDAVDVATSNAVYTGTGAKNVGNNKPVSVTDIVLSGTDAFNYSLAATTATTTAHITPKPVSVSGVTAVDRVYDGTTTVVVQAGTPAIVGLVEGDDATPVLPPEGISSGTMADKHAGLAKPVSVTGLTLSGVDAGNYNLTGAAGTVNIAPRPLTAVFAGIDKVYDGTAAASVTGSSADMIAGDSLGYAQTAVFTGSGAKNAGTGKPIGVSGITLNGNDRLNYTLQNTTATAEADITPKPITASYTGVPRVYNGVDDRSVAVIGSSPGLIANDGVGFNQTARFAGDGSAGANKPVEVSNIALAGVNAGNYQLNNTTAVTTANINPRALGVTGMTAVDRVYDGTLTVQVNVNQAAVDLAGVLAGDQVTVSLPPEGITSGTMADRHVGVDKPVTVTGLLLGGAAASNYTLAGGGGLVVNIDPKALTAVYTGVDKVYDGGTLASVLGSSTDLVAGDIVGIAASGQFSGGKAVGSDKAVTVAGAFLTGLDRANYLLVNPTGATTADITPRTLTAVYAGGTRVYDGTVAAPVTATLANLVAGDVVSSAQTAVFTGAGAKNVGNNKPIEVSGITIAGADAGNYVLASDTAAAGGNITPRPIVIEGLSGAVATNRVYDGTRTVQVQVPDGISGQPRDGDVIAGDQVTVSVPPAGVTTGTMADKHVGTAKSVVITGLALGGSDAGNYQITGAGGVTVDITRLDITASYAGVDKVYDGTTLAGVLAGSAGLIGGDAVSLAASGQFADRNVGTNKAISVAGGALAGADAGNYRLLNPEGEASASITPRPVSASYTGGTRVYDGTTAAPVTGTLQNMIAGDQLTLSQTAAFTGSTAKNAGENKPISVGSIALAGDDAGNYQLTNNAAAATGTVTPRPVVVDGLTVTATPRVYDGTVNVAVEVLAADGAGPRPGDLIAGDDVSVTVPGTGVSTGTMADKHAGSGKSVVVTGLALAGVDAVNYMIVGSTGLTVDIAPKPLTATWSGVDKVYDGTANATALGSSGDQIAGDSLAIGGSGLFTAGKNVGTGLLIEISGGLLTGADAANYTLQNPTGSATAAITPRPVNASYAGGTREYDGTTVAPVTGVLQNVIAGDTLTLGQSAVFTGPGAKNFGSAKPVAVSGITLAGADAGNYALQADSAVTTASVTPKLLQVSGLTGLAAVNRVYDGTRSVALTGTAGGDAPTLQGIVVGDEVTLGQGGGTVSSGTMLDKHVGQAKPVVIDGLTLAGADAFNYQLGGVAGLTVDITPRPVTTSGLVALNRVYDGTLAVALDTSAAGLSGVLAGDDLRLLATGATGTLADKNAGLGKTVAVAGALFEGLDRDNYAVQAQTVTVDIAPRPATLVGQPQQKLYGDTPSFGSSLFTAEGLVDGETVGSVAAASDGLAAGARVGEYTLTISGATGGTFDPANYLLSYQATALLVNPRPLTLTALLQSKRYGDLFRFTGTEFTADGLVNGETVGSVALASDGEAVGRGVGPYTITIENPSGGSFDKDNYAITRVPGRLDVLPRPLTIAAQTVLRFEDEANPASVGFATSQGGLVNGDSIASVVIPLPPASVGAPAGSVFVLTPSGLQFASGSASNYALRYQDGLLIVLPQPPSPDDPGGGGDGEVRVVLNEAQERSYVRSGEIQLNLLADLLAGPDVFGLAPPDDPGASPGELDALLNALLRGETVQLTVAQLKRLPLVALDVRLRQLLQGAGTR